MDLISSGRLFQVSGAVTQKAREAVTVFVLGTTGRTLSEEATILLIHGQQRAMRDILAGDVGVS